MASFVMMMALTSVGCQNKSCDASVAQVGNCASDQSVAHVYTGSAASSGYPSASVSQYGDDHYGGYDLRSSIRSTLWSFVLGHDPDGVPTVAEIEAGLESGRYSASAYPKGY
jgi:hypothetical protein